MLWLYIDLDPRCSGLAALSIHDDLASQRHRSTVILLLNDLDPRRSGPYGDHTPLLPASVTHNFAQFVFTEMPAYFVTRCYDFSRANTLSLCNFCGFIVAISQQRLLHKYNMPNSDILGHHAINSIYMRFVQKFFLSWQSGCSIEIKLQRALGAEHSSPQTTHIKKRLGLWPNTVWYPR